MARKLLTLKIWDRLGEEVNRLKWHTGDFTSDIRRFSTKVASSRKGSFTARNDNEDHEVPVFKPRKALVLSKLSRFEFEQRRNPGLSEEQLAKKLAGRGSDYTSLVYHHNLHKQCVDNMAQTLRSYGIETRVIKRFDYDREMVDWADVVVTAGGDGTFLLAASRIYDSMKPVIGVNSDPSRSEGYLCLPKSYNSKFSQALEQLMAGQFRWKYRQRIRITLTGAQAFDPPVELHDQQLKYPEYRFLDCVHEQLPSSPLDSPPTNEQLAASSLDGSTSTNQQAKVNVLPVLALNEVFVGESLSSRVSYYEITFDNSPAYKQKSSGITICTGTGSTSWYFNINKVTTQCVNHLLKIFKEETGSKVTVTEDLLRIVTNRFNSSLLFDASEPKMAYTIRDPVVNGTVNQCPPRGHADRIEIKSRCYDACVVIDGGLSFPFNDGSRATLEIRPEDALKTVELNEVQ